MKNTQHNIKRPASLFRLKTLTLLMSFTFAGSMIGGMSDGVAQSVNNDFLKNNSTFELTQEDERLGKKAKELQDQSSEIISEDWLQRAMNPDPRYVQQAQMLMESLNESNQAHTAIPNVEPEMQGEYVSPLSGEQYEKIIFITYALGDQALHELLAHASEQSDVLLVMRGVPEGQTLYEGIMRIQQMASEYEPVPNIMIDPELFKQFNIEVAPTIVQVQRPNEDKKNDIMKSLESVQGIEDLGSEHIEGMRNLSTALDQEALTEIARVEGLTNSNYLSRQIEEGQRGDLGVRGPVVEIAEPDLIEVMKQQAARIDWEEQKEGAIRRVWQNQHFHYLANAPRERVRLIDPSVIIQEDIITTNGEYIAKRGDVINPFNYQPMDFALVIFNPLEKKQIPLVKAHGERLKKLNGVNKVMYLATEIDREEGWDFYNALSDDLDEHVFLLTPDVKERFRIEYTPSLVQAHQHQFMVTELPIDSDPVIESSISHKSKEQMQ